MAEEWFLAGCAVHPAKPDGSKVPKAWQGGGPDGKWGWKRFSTGELERLPLEDVLRMCRGAVDGIGIFCGGPSGQLEMLELEGRAADQVPVIEARADERGIGDLWRRVNAGCSEQSPSGGIHWMVRVSDGPALGNVKLALRPGPGGDVRNPDTIAETRGSGGWVVVAGSFGRTHGSGRPYVMRTGSPATIAVVTAAERDALHDLFRTLDELPQITSPEPRAITKRERPAGGDLLPGDDFKQRGTWQDVFPAGWARIEAGDKSDAWSKHGAGGRKSADVFHETDTVYVYATGVPGCRQSLGKFSAYAWLNHAGDFKAAAAALYAAGYGTRSESKASGRLHELQPVRVELREAPVEAVNIDQYRRDIVQAIGEVVLDGSPGVKLLRGQPGTGKTFAVARTVARYGRGVTSVPSHELAAEVVQQLRAAGADAHAYPRLDESSCRNFEQASRAQSAGLSAGATVCTKCPLRKRCREDGYLAELAAAAKADHQVVTHARLSRSMGRLLEKADYLVLEEDASSALRPMVSATRRQLERIARLADDLPEAERRMWILEGVDIGEAAPEPVEEFAAWAPDAGGLTDVGGDDGKSPPPATRAGSFFAAVCRIAGELAAEIGRAMLEDAPVGIRQLQIRAASSVPKNPEGEVWKALDTLDRVDPEGTAELSADAMRLVLAIATGRPVDVFLQAEDDHRPGCSGRRRVDVVGVWRTSLGGPAGKMPVFVCDGTAEVETLARIVDGQVVDITPAGSAPLLHESVQYPVDILPTTSTARVASILTGIVRARPQLERVGFLGHQRHFRELIEAEDSPLPEDVRRRIRWATYYGSGADRGTNTLHAVCDLAVVVGTYRPPPSEIRRQLVRWGELEAAASSATWGRIERHGTAPDGSEAVYHGRGYAEASWARAADAVTRAAMRQAVGRARAICPNGVGVVAVTTENVGLPVADAGSMPVADLRIDQVVLAVERLASGQNVRWQNGVKMGNFAAVSQGENRAEIPIRRIGDSARFSPPPDVTAAAVSELLPGVSPRSVQVWLTEAVECGRLVRTGSARATRYWLPGTAPAEAAPPVPLVSCKVEPPAIAPPPVVPETAPPPGWIAAAVSPERHPDALLELRFLLAGPYARELGPAALWEKEVAKPLVRRLHVAASLEAKRQGKPPPSVAEIAPHTCTWFAVAAAG